MKLLTSTLLYLVFLALAFPLFYFVYKFADPEPLAHDFFQYYWLYKDLDTEHVIAPHNMRMVGAFFIYLFYKANFYYDTISVYDKYVAWGFLKQVYFNALLVNYLSVAATCLALFHILNRHFKNTLFSFGGALLYLLGFGTIFYSLAPLTDAFSILLFTWSLYFYLNKNYYVIPFLVILIFQREYLLIALGTWAFMDYLFDKARYYLIVFISCTLFFVLYMVLRKTVFYTPHLDFQASADFMWTSLFQQNFPFWMYVKQTAMTLNLFYLYVAVFIYKKIKGLKTDALSFIKIIILLIQINLICHVAGHGNNCGRYFYMLIPLVIFLLLKEIFPLITNKTEDGKAVQQNI